MRKTISTLFFVVGILFATLELVKSDDTANYSVQKIGILDIDEVMATTGAADRAMKKIIKQYAPEGKILEKEERALQKEVGKYNDASDKLQADEIKEWQHRIGATQSKLQQKQMELQERIMAAQEVETQKIISKFSIMVSKVAEKNNLAMVFFKDVTTYNLIGTEMHDITKQIIKMAVGSKKKI